MSQRITRFLILLAVMATAVAVLYQQQQLMAESQGGSAATCQGGMADIYPCHRTDLLSFTSKMDLGVVHSSTLVANLWGWTDSETGKEYVLLTSQEGTSFVDISDPYDPVYLGILPTHVHTPATPLSDYRDVKVYQDYAVIVGDFPSENGMQLFDLTTLRTVTTPTVFSETVYYNTDLEDGHNLFVHEETGYAYVARRSVGPDCERKGVTIVDLNDPLNPQPAGCFEEGDIASDSTCVLYNGDDVAYHGREICAVASDDNLVIADFTDKPIPVTATLATRTYQHAERIHSVWFTEDHNYLLSVDMDDEHHHGLDVRIFIWDMTDLDNIPNDPMIYTGPTSASDHNIFVKGNYAYVGNLTGGLRVLDLSNIAEGDLTEVAYFDDFPESDSPGHTLGGAWAVFPYFESGVVAIASRNDGLLLVKPNGLLTEKSFLPIILR